MNCDWASPRSAAAPKPLCGLLPGRVRRQGRARGERPGCTEPGRDRARRPSGTTAAAAAASAGTPVPLAYISPSVNCGGELVLERGLAVPLERGRCVQRHAAAVGVHQAQVRLGARVALVRRLAQPRDGLTRVLRHAVAVGVHQAEVELRADVPLRRRPLDPAGRLAIVGGHAVAGGVADAERELRLGLAALGGRTRGRSRSRGRLRRRAPCQPRAKGPARSATAGTAGTGHRPAGGGDAGGCTPRPRGPNCTDSRRLGNTWTRDLKRQPSAVFT